jgi:hypothetical protein
MKNDLMRLTEILIDKIKRDYKDDVSIVHIHGSYAFGETHELSDLDIYLVPKTQRGFNLGCTFIFDGIGCDFWALSWERLEQIASHGERTASIITDGKVIYYGTNEDLTRFEQLKERASDTSNREEWLTRARKALDEAYKDGFNLQNAKTLTEVRTHSIVLIYNLSYVLAQLNQITIKRGRKLLKQEILEMPLVPDNFEALYDTVFLNNDIHIIKAACVSLLQNTEKKVSAAMTEPSVPFAELFGGWYEEMIQSYNKIYHACEVSDVYTPLFASVEFTYELEKMLERVDVSPKLPDMVAEYDSGDLNKIASAAHAHQASFESLLRENGIHPLAFSTYEEVQQFTNEK